MSLELIKTAEDLKALFSEKEKDNYCMESYKIILDYVLDVNNEVKKDSVDVDKLSKQFQEYQDIREAYYAYDADSYFDDSRPNFGSRCGEYYECDIIYAMEEFFNGLWDELSWWEVRDDSNNPKSTVILIYDTNESRIG